MLSKIRHKSALAILLLYLQACTAVNEADRNEQSPFTLEKVQREVRATFPSVKQLSTSALAGRLANPESLVLLDVRTPQEFAVSHLPGAVRTDPKLIDISVASTPGLINKEVVFYCAVGVRSSKLAQKLQSELMRKGAISIFNLDGGIFAWHNEKRPLVDANGATNFVHPFDRQYKKLLHRQSLARCE